MTIILSEQQQAVYDAGGWDSWRLQDDLVELASRLHWDGVVIVEDMEGKILFGLTPVRQGPEGARA